jgi:hypothetical protein
VRKKITKHERRRNDPVAFFIADVERAKRKSTLFSFPSDQIFLSGTPFRKMEILAVVLRRAKKGLIPHGSALGFKYLLYKQKRN